jgi:Flp pilus assembly protein TadD
MPFPTKAHWTAILAIGLPLVISGCSQTAEQNNMAATAPAPAPVTTVSTANVNASTLARDLEAEGNYANAAMMYQQAVANNPNDIQALLGLGDNNLAIGALDQAAMAYAQVLELDPNNSRGLRGLASARIMKGEPQFAVAQLERAVQINPHDHKALNTLGVTRDMMGQQAAAQASYRRILKEDPQNQSAKNNLALSLALSGNTDESIRLLEEIGSSTRATPIGKQNLALVYAAAGRTEDAMMLAQSGAAAGTVQQVAALYSATSQEDRKILLRRAFGIEFKGTQFVTPNQQIAVISHVEETAYSDGVVNITTGPQQTQAPSILNLKTNVPDSKTTASTAKKPAAKSTDEAWADDWNEELVDAADIAGMQPSQPSTETASVTPEATPPATPTANAATATVTEVEPAKEDDNVPLPMGSAGPVSDPVESTRAAETTETPVQVAEVNDHAAGAIAVPATPTETPHAAPASTPVANSVSSTDASAAKSTDDDIMVKRTQSAATHKEPAPVSTSTAKDIQVAALPPAETAKPVITGTTNQATAEPKKLVKETTVTTQTVNAAKIYTVQIASFRKEDEAKASWQMLKTEQSDLAALPHNVEKADLGKDKGIYYRLQAGTFADKKDATSLCTSLQKRAIECMVVESKQVSMNDIPSAQPATSVH